MKLTEPSKDTVQTSYALRLDRGSGNEVKNIETFSQYALRNLQDMDIVYPGTKWLTPERAAWIAQDFSDFEKSLYSYDSVSYTHLDSRAGEDFRRTSDGTRQMPEKCRKNAGNARKNFTYAAQPCIIV